MFFIKEALLIAGVQKFKHALHDDGIQPVAIAEARAQQVRAVVLAPIIFQGIWQV